MAVNTECGCVRRWSHRRTAAWIAATALVLLVPLVAMQFSDEVDWTVSDFAFATLLILGMGVPFELTMRKNESTPYRAGVGVALAAAFLLVWLNGAVGIIGSEDNEANLMYGGVLAVGVVGSAFAYFRPAAMFCVMLATALAQALVTIVALAAGLGFPESGPPQIMALNGFFIVLWITSAALFWEAASEGPKRDAQ